MLSTAFVPRETSDTTPLTLSESLGAISALGLNAWRNDFGPLVMNVLPASKTKSWIVISPKGGRCGPSTLNPLTDIPRTVEIFESSVYSPGADASRTTTG